MYPSIEQVKDLLKDYKTVPVFYELLVDSFTPVQLFNCLHESYENCFILESVDSKDQWGRYSYIGINPKVRYTLKDHTAVIKEQGKEPVSISTDDPISFFSDIIEQHKAPKFNGRPKLTGGLIGYFAYDMVRYFEKTLAEPPADDLNMPDADMHLFDELVAYDHLSNKAVIILNINASDNLEEKYASCERRKDEIIGVLHSFQPKPVSISSDNVNINIRSNISKEDYLKNVERSKEYIRNGDIFQIVPSQRFEIDNPPDSFDVYRMLRSTNPSPYLYYFSSKEYSIAGASPEMLVSVNDRTVITRPIAGTIKRGETMEEDIRNEAALISNPKERAEHTMLVDLGRNDIGKVSEFGSVNVMDYMIVERYSKVMHLVSNVKGTLRKDKKPLDALMALLPAGTLSGAPKVRAMEIIDELETVRRGLYGGTVGYLAFDGSKNRTFQKRKSLCSGRRRSSCRQHTGK